MSTQSINCQVLALRKSGGYSAETGLAAVEIAGADAARLLQARLSNDVLAIKPGEGQETCLLDRKANILVMGSLHCLPDRFLMLIDRKDQAKTLALFEEFRFREQVTFRALDELAMFSVDSTKCDLLLLRLTKPGHDSKAEIEWKNPADSPPRLRWKSDVDFPPTENAIAELMVDNDHGFAIRRSTTGEPGLLFLLDSDAVTPLLKEQCQALNLVEISPEARTVAQLEAGNLGFRWSGIALPESGLESKAASYSKGCFPGQEILARIRTYGAPRQGTIGFVFEQSLKRDGKDLGTELPIFRGDTEIGVVRLSAFSPTLGTAIAIALVQREFRVPDQRLELVIADSPCVVTTRTLPFYTSAGKSDQATVLYKKALAEFTDGSENEAVQMLREVIDLQPMMADAYETLGVILNRHDQLDEAIGLMQQLAALDQSSIMAHANLSVFYMQKGDKEAAENEKAIAMSLRMSAIARSAADEEQENEQRRKLKEAAEDRMRMFREVLSIDPDDFLANAGLGSVYVDLEQYEQALPFLQKALSQKPNHTVAYVSLAEAFERLGRTADAIETYTKGIAVAAQRGDGEPLKKMQIRLKHLEPKVAKR